MSVGAALLAIASAGIARGDANTLYGIHWWGYTPGQGIDTSPATMLDCPAYSAWDVETVVTNSAPWWAPSYFVPLYQNLYVNKNVTVITRIDYDWGQTVPSPTNPNYGTWPTTVVGAVNTLRSYAHIWILGNEPNIVGEGNGWPSGQITPAGYATIYRNVRTAVHNSALASPAGPHWVLVAPPSPGGIIPGVRWMDGNVWLSQVLDNIPAEEVDGLAIHAYGGSVSDFHAGYTSQLALIDSKGHGDKPVYMTEWAKAATPGNAATEAASAQFVRDSLADVNAWNQGEGNHNIICLAWYVWDANQQAGGSWDGTSIEYWRDNGNPAGHSGDLYTAFQQTVDLRYPAGIVGTRGSAVFNNNTPTGINLALTAAAVQTDSVYGPGWEGTKAIDGVVSAASKWTSNDAAPPHWLALDLGGSYTVNGYILRLPGAAGELTGYNATAVAIQSASAMAEPWTDEGSIGNPLQADIVARSYNTPRMLRYVRLFITGTGIDNYARIPEFEVWGGVPPIAAFIGSPTSGRAPLAVQFTDQSTGEISSWAWTFGDGGTASVASPVYTYQNPGTFTVSLTVSGPGGNSTATRVNYITVAAPPAGVPGDTDGDEDVDVTDFGVVQACLTGPGVPQDDPACAKAKLDSDGDVDADDVNLFLGCLSGPLIPGDRYCTE